MRHTSFWGASALVLGSLISCAKSPPPAFAGSKEATKAAAPAKKKQPPSAQGSAAQGSAAQGSTTDSKTAAAPKKKVPEPAHCPPEMVYVEGDYCTASSNDAEPDENGNTPGAGAKDIDAIERTCVDEWYAEQNKKRVCEEFAPGAKCTGKMVPKRFCIDRYEWPNVKGQRPEVMNRFHQAEVKCAAAGKRLCTESEWTFACEGEDMKPFPYGNERDVGKCHGDEEWDSPNMSKVADRDSKELRRLYKAKRSGELACESDFGVHDLPGNADEIVASETNEAGWRGKYDSVTTGGPWYKGVRNQCRPKIYTHDEGFYHYYMSFRCCAEADGAETDPRTPRQQKQGWDMKRVEKIAGISVEEMRDLLEKAKTDPTCGCKTTKCRTFCGTLHGDPGTGPDAWNPPLGKKAGNGMKPR
jgi:sulfatase modifying factor 1